MTREAADFYSRHAEEFAEDHPIEEMPQAYINLLDRFVELVEGGKVLDAGCGTGRDAAYFANKSLEVVGVDLGEGMLEKAREKPGEYFEMDVRDLDFGDGEFDGIWCNTVLHFFSPEKMGEVVEELVRVVEDNGVLYVSFKLGEGRIEREAYGDSVTQYLVSEEYAREVLESQDLDVIEFNRSETTGGFRKAGIFARK